MFTLEEHNGITKQILENLSSQGTVSEFLTQLTDNYAEIVTTNENFENLNNTLNSKIEQLEENIKQLKDSNMKLFLQVTQIPEKKEDNPDDEDSKKETLTFEELFDENGQLK